MTFELFAAIDLRGGRVVRLRAGDFGRETIYDHDPLAVGRRFAAAGVAWLHVVDLDGARAGVPAQQEAVSSLIVSLAGSVAVEVAGGIRNAQTVARYLSSGARRVVLGTSALARPELVAEMVGEHGSEAIAVALDVRDGRAYGRAWDRTGAGPGIADAVPSLSALGVATFEVTSIERDGSLAGPDVELLERAVELAGPGSRVIAGGGIRSIADLAAVRAVGCRGAIVGRAIYEGTLDLAEAVATGLETNVLETA